MTNLRYRRRSLVSGVQPNGVALSIGLVRDYACDTLSR